MPTTAESPSPTATLSAKAPRYRQQRRRRVEEVLDRARHLPDQDRALIEQVFARGAHLTELEQLSGTSRKRLARRLRSILIRLDDPLFAFLEQHGDLLAPRTRRTAELVVFERRSLRAAAVATGQTLHQVRQHLRDVKALARL